MNFFGFIADPRTHYFNALRSDNQAIGFIGGRKPEFYLHGKRIEIPKGVFLVDRNRGKRTDQKPYLRVDIITRLIAMLKYTLNVTELLIIWESAV